MIVSQAAPDRPARPSLPLTWNRPVLYDVNVYEVVRLKVWNIEAESMEEAIERAYVELDGNDPLPQPQSPIKRRPAGIEAEYCGHGDERPGCNVECVETGDCRFFAGECEE